MGIEPTAFRLNPTVLGTQGHKNTAIAFKQLEIRYAVIKLVILLETMAILISLEQPNEGRQTPVLLYEQ